MFFNPTYLLFLIPALGVAWLAHWRIRVILREAGEVAVRSGASGADAAAAVLESAGVNGVYVEDATGQQLDHYSPAEKGIQLRPEIYSGRSLAAVGIAGHETGHALQDAAGHPLLPARTAIVLSATCGSLIGLILLIGGFLLVERILVYLGIVVFTATVLSQLFNLLIEFDASRRARHHLLAAGVITADEEPAVRRVMHAAACTYLAATLTSIPTAYHYLVRPRRPAGARRLDAVIDRTPGRTRA
jgi:Zn-dependent membrane protease YugP